MGESLNIQHNTHTPIPQKYTKGEVGGERKDWRGEGGKGQETTKRGKREETREMLDRWKEEKRGEGGGEGALGWVKEEEATLPPVFFPSTHVRWCSAPNLFSFLLHFH